MARESIDTGAAKGKPEALKKLTWAVMSDTILDKIKAYKLEEIAVDKAKIPLSDQEAAAYNATPPRRFYESLLNASKTGYGLLLKSKKPSPSKGLIRADFDPATHAKDYEAGGATCLSVLTDTPSFQGAKNFRRCTCSDRSACVTQGFHMTPIKSHKRAHLGRIAYSSLWPPFRTRRPQNWRTQRFLEHGCSDRGP